MTISMGNSNGSWSSDPNRVTPMKLSRTLRWFLLALLLAPFLAEGCNCGSEQRIAVSYRPDGHGKKKIDSRPLQKVYSSSAGAPQAQDTDGDGEPDTWTYPEGDGRKRVESDRNGDGKVDIWKFFENDELVGLSIDKNFDGVVDQRIDFSGSEFERSGPL